MKFSINRTELQTALSVVLKGVSASSTLPVLAGGIFAEAAGDSLILQSTDLVKSIKYTLPALVEEEGRTVFLGKLLLDIVKNLPDAAVHIADAGDSASITCDTISYDVKTLSPEDFPDFPNVAADQEVRLLFPLFSSMVKKVARIVSRDESRAILTGVLLSLEGDVLKMVATDSYRLAVAQAQVPAEDVEDFEAVIGGSFLQEIAALPKSEEDVRLGLSENQVVVTYQNTVFINRRIGGVFPNYRQLLPESHATRVRLRTEDVLSAVKRTSVLSQSSSPVRFAVDLDAPIVQLSSVAQDVGSAQQSLSCEGEGESMEIAFNGAYLVDGLSSVPSEFVNLDLQDSMKPGIFTAEGDESYLYLVMPVRIS
ncbi:DNA polymerase III subunit beta [Xiamenia xianingshaonis]|uniref:Beta sliding clamp n=1 Tax=Xiamenia xianingshaonis TaxID=2682776 RepID=A0A9E6SUB6_9ACTN|nr:DNA polymerase III subunit beta [Xiamenia xianingshaonis]NHM13946.1 DNA polymerase III subunit beta [Xiamenia xianingshaonis]QTU84370.1 DNA polymerase III subunit beta [Xiamenia xianingshaonis]